MHSAQCVESYHYNLQGGVGGVFHGQQVIQHQPVIFMGLPEGGSFHRESFYQPTVPFGYSNYTGEMRVSMQPVSDHSHREVPFYDVNGCLMPVINSMLPASADPYSTYQNQALVFGSESNVTAPESFSAGAEQDSASILVQELQSAAGGSSLRTSDTESVRMGRRRRRRRNGRSQDSLASSGMGAESNKNKDARSKNNSSSVAALSLLKNGSSTHRSTARIELAVEQRVKEEFSIPLSSIPDMRKKLRLLIDAISKGDSNIFVDLFQGVVESIGENRSQHVWVPLSEFELQLLVDARNRLYQISRGCSQEERAFSILQIESIFARIDPVIARSFEEFLGGINDSVSEVLFRTLNVLVVDFMMGVQFKDIDLGKLIPFIHKVPLTISSELADKISRYFEICERDQNTLVMNLYQDFNRRLAEDGCITLQKNQIKKCFDQFYSAFFNLSNYVFHRNEGYEPVDRMAWMQDVKASQHHFLSRYKDMRGEQLALRRSKLEDEIIDGEDVLHSEKSQGVEHCDDKKTPERVPDPNEVETILSDEKMCDRACELFRSGDTNGSKALYERVLARGGKPLITFSCRLALIEVEFKQLSFDRDYLSFREIIRKSHRIFNDFRSACSFRDHQLETKACELEQISDEANKVTELFYDKWSLPIEQQHFSIDGLKASLASLSEGLSGDDLDRLEWYLKEVEQLHEKMGGILPLLVSSTYRLDQAFDDRESWLSGIPRKMGMLEGADGEEAQSLSLSASKHQERLRSNGQRLEVLVHNHKRLHDELADLKKEKVFSGKAGSPSERRVRRYC
ncbi:hypothetical protein [Endozoicomonas sp.]|uniref:hypothetical protein n=1 Tax=Endozoicomonas sp. TaxID=1892382 RepID=UPI003AF6F4F7